MSTSLFSSAVLLASVIVAGPVAVPPSSTKASTALTSPATDVDALQREIQELRNRNEDLEGQVQELTMALEQSRMILQRLSDFSTPPTPDPWPPEGSTPLWFNGMKFYVVPAQPQGVQPVPPR